MCIYLHISLRPATFVSVQTQSIMTRTRNFPTFNGPVFVQGATEFKFVCNHPKKADVFIYEVLPISNSYFDQLRQQAAMRQDWFDCQFNYREMMKFINRQLNGKLTGASKTTMSLYSTLKSGYRVRVSDHIAHCQRSKSDIYIIIGGRDGSPTISVNDSAVEIDWNAAMLDAKSLYQAVCDKVVCEIDFLESWK